MPSARCRARSPTRSCPAFMRRTERALFKTQKTRDTAKGRVPRFSLVKKLRFCAKLPDVYKRQLVALDVRRHADLVQDLRHGALVVHHLSLIHISRHAGEIKNSPRSSAARGCAARHLHAAEKPKQAIDPYPCLLYTSRCV